MFFLTSGCRSVNPQNDQQDRLKSNSCRELAATTTTTSTCTSLTVWRKSLIFSCKGFTVIGSDGSLVYRVDNYSGRRDQIILMDGSGKPILTIRRHKKLGLVDNNWFIYEGEVLGDDYCHSKSSKISSSLRDDYYHSKSGKISSSSSASLRKKPIFCVKKNMKMLQSNIKVLAHVYYQGISNQKRYSYIIEGSYANRSCKVLDAKSRNVVAEIRKKQAITDGVTFGLEVFVLVVMPGFDSGFAMGMVLLLDQMFS